MSKFKNDPSKIQIMMKLLEKLKILLRKFLLLVNQVIILKNRTKKPFIAQLMKFALTTSTSNL